MSFAGWLALAAAAWWGTGAAVCLQDVLRTGPRREWPIALLLGLALGAAALLVARELDRPTPEWRDSVILGGLAVGPALGLLVGVCAMLGI